MELNHITRRLDYRPKLTALGTGDLATVLIFDGENFPKVYENLLAVI
jgi:hypothetical protein